MFPEFYGVVLEHLRRWLGDAPTAWVCTTPTGRVLMDTSYRSQLAAAKRRAGVTCELTPHYGRVWLITTLVEAGMTSPAIGEMLGQRDLKTITEVYMRTSEARKREVLDRGDVQLGGVLA